MLDRLYVAEAYAGQVQHLRDLDHMHKVERSE